MQSASASVPDGTRTSLAGIMGKLGCCEAVRSKPSTGIQSRSGHRFLTDQRVEVQFENRPLRCDLALHIRHCVQSTESGIYRPKARAFLTPTMGTSSSRSPTHRWDFVGVNSMYHRHCFAAVIHTFITTFGHITCRLTRLVSLSKVCKLYPRLDVIIL